MEETRSNADQIDTIIALHDGWKGEMISRIRSIVLSVDSEITEEIKWRMATRPEGLPVWSHHGIVCFTEIWKDNIKLIFFRGALLQDPDKLFNARLKSSEVRAIELREDDDIHETALKNLITEAVQLNISKSKK